MVVLGAILLAAARAVGAVQTLLRLQHPRRLTDAEAALVRRVFRGSLDAATIRVVPGFAGIFSLNGRAVTIGATVYLKRFDTAERPDILVHECTHVWQYRHAGSRYISQALFAQWFVRDAYNWRAELARGHKTWSQFNREAQAQFVQDVYRDTDGAFYADDPVGADATFTVEGTDFTALARPTVAQLRAGPTRR